MKRAVILLFLFLWSAPLSAMVCSKDVNGDGKIDPLAEKWQCAATSPPVCPQDLVACIADPYTATGGAEIAATNIAGRNGISRLAAGTKTIDISGWTCNGMDCRETYAGSIVFSPGKVSGAVRADKITRLQGKGETIEIYGCNGSGCTETLLGAVTVTGALFSGTAAAENGITGISASGGALSFAGAVCGETGCTASPAGTITLSGTAYACPAGDRYPCVDVNGVKRCSPLACTDQTLGGQASQKICAKDLNGDGNIDFAHETANCTAVSGGDFCPLEALNCGIVNTDPLCPSDGTACLGGGSYNPVLKRCESPFVNLSYRCPTTGGVYSDAASCSGACSERLVCTASSSTAGTVTGPQEWSQYIYRISCSGDRLNFYYGPTGGNGPAGVKSFTVSGMNCAYDLDMGQADSVLNYLSGNGQGIDVYKCVMRESCDDNGCSWNFESCGVPAGRIPTPGVTVTGVTRSGWCLIDALSGIGTGGAVQPSPNALSTHNTCIWEAWYHLYFTTETMTCPEGNFPCRDGYCEAAAACIPDQGCPAGYSPANDACIAPPVGGTETSLNGSRDLCETASSAGCPAGFTLDSARDLCIRPVSCPPGGSFDASANLCVHAFTTADCPQGFSFSAAQDSCLKNPECPGGGIFNPLRNVCEQAFTPACPSNQTYDPGAGVCQAAAICDAGLLNGTLDKCAVSAASLCPSGYTFNGARDRCEAAPPCPVGSAYSAGADACTLSPGHTCPSGGSFNAATGLCEATGSVTCPAGYAYDGTLQTCTAVAACSGGSLNGALDLCQAARTAVCPAGYVYNAARGLCDAGPSCPAGSVYNGTSNRCEVAASSSYRCPTTGITYGNSNSCNAACYTTAACSTVTPTVTVTGPQEWCQYINRIQCSGSTLYFYCSSGGYKAFNITNMNCASDLHLNTDNYVNYLSGNGQGFDVYQCKLEEYCNEDYENWWCYQYLVNCGEYSGYVSTQGVFASGTTLTGLGMIDCLSGYAGNNTINTHNSASWPTWLPIFFNGVPYQTCPLGNYPCSGGACSVGSPCSGPLYSCPAGFTWSGTTCYASATCTTGGSLNGATDRCEVAFTPTCPAGYSYNPTRGNCERSPQCNSPGSYDSALDRCTTSAAGNCPQGYAYNFARGVCEAAATHTCSLAGFTYNAGLDLCLQAVACPSGGGLNGGSDLCEIIIAASGCPAGFAYDAGYDLCLKDPSCPTGTVYSPARNRCEASYSPTCPSGYSYDIATALCKAAPVCSMGTFDGAGHCRIWAAYFCPAGYAFNGWSDRCEAPLPCPGGSQYLPALQVCGMAALHQCPSSYVYNPVLRICEASPICWAGIYDPATDRCFGGATDCPYGSGYACHSNPTTGVSQCSPDPCFEPALQPVETNDPDPGSLHDDGQVDQATGECKGTIVIFNGKPSECRTAGVSTSFFNCCDTSEGSFGPIKERCGESDAQTVQAATAGRCHYIGDYCKEKWRFIGCVQRADVYCCFNSKLGRIIHEQGRAQLKQFNASGDWGSPENPNCRGFTPEEFQMLDFSKIDLTEYFGDIQTKAMQDVQQNMEGKVRDYYQNIR